MWHCWIRTLLLLPLLLPTSLAGEETLELAAILDEARRGVEYHPVSRDELVQAERQFLETIQHRRPFSELARDWSKLGWELRELQLDGDTIWTLMESDTNRRGRGRFTFRPAGPPIVLQAPHGFYDTHTGDVTRQLFLEGQVRAAAWNSVHRKVIDAAHVKQHYFNAFTAAITQAWPDALIVQIHGFSAAQRNSMRASHASMIVSNGTSDPARWFTRISQILQPAEYGDVLLFPYDADELGATTNEQGKIVRNAGNDGFLHLEMSEQLRRRLQASPSLRRQLVNDLDEVYRRFQ